MGKRPPKDESASKRKNHRPVCTKAVACEGTKFYLALSGML